MELLGTSKIRITKLRVRRALLKTKIQWEDGYVIPSKAPGLGVELNEEVALAHTYHEKGLHLSMAQHPLGYF